jgi:steroid delta-isomerase-like uncharacterized protein
MGTPVSVVEQFSAAYNDGDVEGLLALCSDDVTVIHHNRDIEVHGKEALGGLFGSFAQAFPDKRFLEPTSIVAEGENVVVEHTWTGTVEADVPGFAAAGEVAKMDLSTRYTVRDGLIVEYHDFG